VLLDTRLFFAHHPLGTTIQKLKHATVAMAVTMRNLLGKRKPRTKPTSTITMIEGQKNGLPFAKKSPGVASPHAIQAAVNVQKPVATELTKGVTRRRIWQRWLI